MKKDNKTSKEKGFFEQLIDNVSEGANLVAEKVKETTAKAYVSGSELVEDTSEKIHDYTEKQTLLKEKHKLEDQQEELTHSFGRLSLENYLTEGHLHKTFLTKVEVNDIVESYKSNAKRIQSINKEIKKLETK